MFKVANCDLKNANSKENPGKLEVAICDLKFADRKAAFKITNCDLERNQTEPTAPTTERCSLQDIINSRCTMPDIQCLIPVERIEQSILLLRGQKVMLDEDLAKLYEVETKMLVRAVKRNRDRFPADFAFQLFDEEFEHLRSQIGTSSSWGGRRYTPYAFTEQGVAMLSGVLRSPRAVAVNIEIMRAFVRLRQMLTSHADLARKIDAMEKKYDSQFKVVFDALRQLMQPPPDKTKRQIGFHAKLNTDTTAGRTSATGKRRPSSRKRGG